ncbi:catechol 2,3-dioxygenase-like lactoylglutathione lyase family enzyme [Brevundimonas alba]|uniref:Catechol 2,3-dioxygenase-like lactoylglutathione lyase family enzyme n=1 Tax=Brevundimonas alba TaxID=74314 RepID=A0A7X5YK22_9CAUL|nr:VOC family protein [Brevundimonas alba]NJC41385.1 catechol 2,3-dioxygenase-like lactoylglutathione lyase family enzyme [Brevundimonas alba]
MLKDRNSSAIVAVSDIGRARRFYSETLGLELAPDSGEDPLMFRTGSTTLGVYTSEFAGTNKANAVVWGVGDELEAIVADLRGKGVSFERYDFEGAEFADGIHRFGDFRAAWFKDPDGNILHINSGD